MGFSRRRRGGKSESENTKRRNSSRKRWYSRAKKLGLALGIGAAAYGAHRYMNQPDNSKAPVLYNRGGPQQPDNSKAFVHNSKELVLYNRGPDNSKALVRYNRGGPEQTFSGIPVSKFIYDPI